MAALLGLLTNLALVDAALAPLVDVSLLENLTLICRAGSAVEAEVCEGCRLWAPTTRTVGPDHREGVQATHIRDWRAQVLGCHVLLDLPHIPPGPPLSAHLSLRKTQARALALLARVASGPNAVEELLRMGAMKRLKKLGRTTTDEVRRVQGWSGSQWGCWHTVHCALFGDPAC